MNDFIHMVLFERKTILRGWIVSTLCILPFGFIPTLLKQGFSFPHLIANARGVFFFSAMFALIVVGAALIHNYQSLVERKRIFDRAAFVALDFHGMLDGVGSIVHELETFLFGQMGNFHYRISILDPDLDTTKIHIIPLIDIEGKNDLIKELENQGFEYIRFFGLVLHPQDDRLDEEDYLLEILESLSEDLDRLGVVALDLDPRLRSDLDSES